MGDIARIETDPRTSFFGAFETSRYCQRTQEPRLEICHSGFRGFSLWKYGLIKNREISVFRHRFSAY